MAVRSGAGSLFKKRIKDDDDASHDNSVDKNDDADNSLDHSLDNSIEESMPVVYDDNGKVY